MYVSPQTFEVDPKAYIHVIINLALCKQYIKENGQKIVLQCLLFAYIEKVLFIWINDIYIGGVH